MNKRILTQYIVSKLRGHIAMNTHSDESNYQWWLDVNIEYRGKIWHKGSGDEQISIVSIPWSKIAYDDLGTYDLSIPLTIHFNIHGNIFAKKVWLWTSTKDWVEFSREKKLTKLLK